MATELPELDELFDPGLKLTVRGTKYTVPLPSGELGLWCQRAAEAGGALAAADSEAKMAAAVARINAIPELEGDLTLTQRLLGPVYGQMLADEVPHHFIEFCAATTYVWIIRSEDAAKRFWESGGRPEALRPANRATRRAAAKTGGSRTAAATKTPSAASTSGTTSLTTSGRASKAATKRAR